MTSVITVDLLEVFGLAKSQRCGKTLSMSLLPALTVVGYLLRVLLGMYTSKGSLHANFPLKNNYKNNKEKLHTHVIGSEKGGGGGGGGIS